MSGMVFRNHIKFYPLVFLICITFLQGCAGQVNILPTLTEGTPVNGSDGIVVARVINASGNPLPFNQFTINPENLNESETIKPERLLAIRPKLNGTTVFASSVHPGNYSLSSIRAYYSNGNGWYNRVVGADEKLGTFTVKQGEVTDLGTIIYYPKPQGDRYSDLLVRAPESEQGEVLSKHFPFFNYTATQLNGWQVDENDQERESAYLSIAQNPLTYNSQYLAPDNSIYFLGKIGVLIKRTPLGEWELDGVDTNHELTAIAQNKNGDLVVGGSEGALFWKPENGDWLDISLEHDSHIEHLLLSDTGEIDILASQDFDLNIFRGKVLNSGVQWELLNSYTSRSGKGWNHNLQTQLNQASPNYQKESYIYSTNLFKINGKHYLTLRTQSFYGDVVFADIGSELFTYNPENWVIEQEVEDFKLSAIVEAGAVQLGIEKAGFWSWSGKPTYYRIDVNGGQEKISTHINRCKSNGHLEKPCRKKAFTFRSAPWFSSENNAVAIVGFTETGFSYTDQKTEIEILTTTDGGKSWAVTDNKPPTDYCTSVVPHVSDRLLIFCDGASGDFFESTNYGESWDQVRQQDNF
ncbi:hypothetical protein MO867_14385 [Microbulbifer sp. OS29]|uniref:Uncharacterized protein n=1 Tax=Microbulbifer okhotskensis TaxID=2926617 RepID=A0A9X2ENK6_9GAMM|nr:hypothetical protein [Microbulbifer okhotskensis]MCO1335524.1 hypothetical protein [Microbulbifer okhotskensis]